MGSAFLQTISTEQVGADQEGVGLAGSAGSAVARDSGVALAQGASIGGIRTEAGGKTNTGVDIAGNNSGTVTINQAAGVESLGEMFDSTLNKLVDTSNATLNSALQTKAATEDSAASPSMSTNLAKLALWALGIIVVGGVAFAVFERKTK